MTPHLVALLPLQNTEVSHNLLLATKLKKKKYRKEKEKKKEKIHLVFCLLPNRCTRCYMEQLRELTKDEYTYYFIKTASTSTSGC